MPKVTSGSTLTNINFPMDTTIATISQICLGTINTALSRSNQNPLNDPIHQM